MEGGGRRDLSGSFQAGETGPCTHLAQCQHAAPGHMACGCFSRRPANADSIRPPVKSQRVLFPPKIPPMVPPSRGASSSKPRHPLSARISPVGPEAPNPATLPPEQWQGGPGAGVPPAWEPASSGRREGGSWPGVSVARVSLAVGCWEAAGRKEEATAPPATTPHT